MRIYCVVQRMEAGCVKGMKEPLSKSVDVVTVEEELGEDAI